MDCSSPAVACAAALDASLPLGEWNLRPLRGIQTAGFEQFGRITNLRLARIANQTYEPLRQNAVQGRNKVVRLDTHVQEASQHVDHVVRVYRGEYQVSGQRRVDGGLSRFLVADFADHDLVGIVTQNGTQAARKGQALLFVHRNL